MKTVYLSEKADPRLKRYIRECGYDIFNVKATSFVSGPVSSHADIYYCKLGCNDGAPVFCDKKEKLGYFYPSDIIYNAACTGKFFIHDLRHTDRTLMEKAKDMEMIFIDVKQGYSKCSICVVDENSVITADQGIAKKISKEKGPDCLLISPGHIILERHEYGFIGGSCGLIGNEIVFNGDISLHPDFKRISDHIQSRGLSLKWFPGRELEDIGSLL
ncbi:MAG TPA: hypothetical protein PLM92_02700 [Bacillota bacterium]|nr:hypothetical protein [Bacillota bacterium]